MREKLLFPFILLAAFILSGCQTSMLKQFQQVSMGMEKADVLELMGPQETPKDFTVKTVGSMCSTMIKFALIKKFIF